MSDDKIELPKTEIATKDWTMKELMDTERRIEKAFHEQTQFLSQKNDSIQQAFHEQTQFLSQKNDGIQQAFQEQTQFLSKETSDIRKDIANQTRWIIGVMVALIIAVLIKDKI